MSTIHKRFQQILSGSQKPTAVHLHPDLSAAIKEIAAHQNLTFSEVVNELIAQALYAYQLNISSLDTWQQLTKREREVTALIWLGLTNPQIAARLEISTNTVKTHIKKILNKFGVDSKKSLSELLTGLDLSAWVDLGKDTQHPPRPAVSPDGVHP